ncbi:MAG TPA: TonB-dependent receptor [Kofleriaceae bacterium]|nr:TonB-dependent receptor [Kofleriaceae bacterium]
MKRLALVALVWLAPALAYAQAPPDAGVDAPPPDAPPPDAPPPQAQPQFEPPHAIGSTDVAAPANAPAITAPVVVTVKLRVGKDGNVSKVDLVTPPQPPFDDAVIAAAQQFKFQPGTYGGNPVAVEITFTHTFVPPPPPPPPTPPGETGPAKTSVLRGRLIELGTRLPVASATVNVEIDGRRYTTDADQKGHFRIEVPAGHAKITIYAPSHNPFLQEENIAPKQELAVAYLIERDRYDPYEIVVVGEQRREEVSRITLKGPEIQQVPGTFGDPFRVIQALPGVASVVSLLPFPVVRGSSPSSTGFEIDEIRVPLLFHLLAGPSVIHPEFIDEIQFYPGGAPAPYGGYTGGIVDGVTARAAPDAHLIDVDLNLLQVGGLVREPVPDLDATATVAARYGFPGILLSLATNQASLAYWDYQFRLDGGTKTNGWTLFMFGARDELDLVSATADPNAANPPLSPALELEFHRLDLRYHRTFGELETTARVTGGFDKTFSMGTDFWVWSLDPSLRARYKASKQVDMQAGIDGDFRDLRQSGAANSAAGGLSAITSQLSTSEWGSMFAEALWRPTSDWLIRPGIRGDVYHDHTASKADVDPRLTVRYKLGHRDLPEVPPDSDDSAVWLKGSAGIYHQPPRFVVPLPGLDQMPLKYGLLEAYQTSLGTEVPLEHRFELSTEAFFNYMDPTIFDLSTNALTEGTAANNTLLPTSIVTGMDMGQQYIDRLTTPQTGRAYGLEVLLRRRAKSGIFGWISYTLSRSERLNNGVWVPYDYDRTQLFSMVAGLPLRRNWDVGVRVQYQSGLPATTTAGYNTAREDGFWQFDVRVDKRAVWKKWLLDFYVDITNVALLPEEVTPGNTIRYVLPTVGLRGRF